MGRWSRARRQLGIPAQSEDPTSNDFLGLLSGRAVDWVGPVSLELIGVAMVVAAGVAGIHLANEGYVDRAQAWVDDLF